MIFQLRNGISYELNQKDFTAQVISSTNAKGYLFIPRSITYQSKEYLIIKIADNAFRQNRKVESIEFPEDSAIKSIGKNAFTKSLVQRIRIPPSIEELEEGWCKHTSNLTTITISPRNKHFSIIDKKIIVGKSDKKSDNFDSIIFGCRDIQKVVIPSYIKQISSFAFSECIDLSKIEFAENSELYSIEKDAFSYTEIESLSIPSCVAELKDGWCRRTPRLSHISISKENKNFSYFDEKFILGKSDKNSEIFDLLVFANRDIEQASVPSFVKQILPYAFSECDKLSQLEITGNSELCLIHKNAFSYSSINHLFIPQKVEELKDGWCKNMSKLNSISISSKNKRFSTIDNKMIVGKSDLKSDTFNLLVFACRDIERAVIPSNIEIICPFSFSWCKKLKLVEIEKDSKLEIIGKDSFAKSSIEKFIVPSHVNHICDRCFYKCENLESVKFEENSELSLIGRKAFSLSSITSILIPRKVRQIGERCFQECENLYSVKFEDKSEICLIDKYLFSFSWIDHIEIPSSVKEIKERSFSYCKNLKSIQLPNESELLKIDVNAFCHSNLESINIPSSVEELREGWCSYTPRLCNVSLSKDNQHYKYLDNKFIVGKTNENDSEFSNLIFAHRDIEEVIIPSHIQMIGSFAFCECDNLKNVEFSKDSKLCSIHDEAFSYSSIERISIPHNVSEIASRAFYWCRNLKHFEIPEDSELRTIRSEVIFYSSIDKLFIPSNIETFEDGWCDFLIKLNSVSISPNNEHFSCIDNKVIFSKNNDEYDSLIFAGRDVEKVVIPSSVKKIGPFAFSWCKNLHSIVFNEDSKLESIEEEAFSYSTLEGMILPSTVKKIGESSFYKCRNLQSFVIPDKSELITIDKGAFAFTQIESLFIPSKLEEMKEGWCDHTSKLTNIKVSPENKYFSYIDNKLLIDHCEFVTFARRDCEKVKIPNCIKKIKSNSFCECRKLKEVEIEEESELRIIEEGAFTKSSIEYLFIPSKLKELKEGWCKHTSKLNHISISSKNDNFKLIDEKYLVKKSENNNVDFDVIVLACRDIEEAIIPSCIKRIGPFSFHMCKKLKSIQFSNDSNVCIFDKSAFSKSSITNIFIPAKVKQISERAFYRCYDFKSVQFAQNIKLQSIEKEAFSLSSITSILIPRKVRHIGERCFQECENLCSVKFEDKSEICLIDKYLFSFSWIDHIEIPSSVKEIKERSFSYCKNLKSIQLPNESKLLKIDVNAFFNSNLERINLPASVKKLREGWCSYASRLCHVSVSPKNEYYKYVDDKYIIGKTCNREGKFERLEFARRDIEEAIIPSYIKYISSYAFYECEELKNVEFSTGSEIEYIGKETFSSTSIDNIEIPSSIKEIGERTFYWCRNLKNVTIEDSTSIKTLPKEVFFYSSIEHLFIPSSLIELKEGWCDFTWRLNHITVSPNNKNFKVIDNKLLVGKSDQNSDDFDVLLFAVRNITHVIIPIEIKTIGAFAFSWCSYLKSISFPEYSRLTSIEKVAFSYAGFQSITIPKHVIKIGERAFYRCDTLRSVIIPEDSELTTFGKDCFAYTCIKSLYIPSKLQDMKEGWCNHTPYLTNVTISPENKYFAYIDNKLLVGKSNESLSDFEFVTFARRDCEKVKIPNCIKKIKSNSFCECRKLKEIEIEEESELRIIEEGAFTKSSIEYLFIPSKLKELKEGWCKHTSKLNHISISSKNDNFKLIDEKFIVGKSSDCNDDYDILLFACRDIEKAVIPSYIKSIGQFAFSWCKNLQSIEFSKDSKIVSFEKDAFSKSSLKEIRIPSHLKEIGERSFFKCSNFKSIEFIENSEIRLIMKKAFSFTPLKNILIPSSVQQICERSFYSCRELESVEFEKDSELVIIEKYAFSMSSINEILIPSKVNQIGERCFFKCEKLKSVNFAENSQLHSIELKAFSKSSIESIFIPSEVEELKCGWCSHALKLNNISLSPENKYFTFINDNLMAKKSDLKSDKYDVLVFSYRDIEKVVIPSFIKRICSYVFCECSKLKSVVFSENSELRSIDKKAFSKTHLFMISIPSSVKYIKESTFSFCKNLLSCEFLDDSNLCSIDKNVFTESGIKKIKIPSNVAQIDKYSFSYCPNLESIEFSENSKLFLIEENAFFHSNLERINLPASVKKLREGWCSYASRLCHVSVSPKNEYYKYVDDKYIIGKTCNREGKFERLEFARRDIEEAIIPSYIKYISSYAFYECEELKNVEFSTGSEIEYIGKETFSSTSIDNIEIPSSIKEIGERTFYWCRNLKNVTIEDSTSIKTLPKEVFFYSSIEHLFIPSSLIELKEGWCDFTLRLTRVTISPDSCHFFSLDDKMIIGRSDPSIADFDTLLFACRDIRDVFIPSFIKRIGMLAFSWCKNLGNVTFADDSKLEVIDEEAFSYSSLQKIIIPSSVSFIGEEAFANCESLQSIEFPEDSKLAFIGKNIFYRSSIESISIPASVGEIRNGWCTTISKLNHFSISPQNKDFIVFNDDFIIGKSDKNGDDFDLLIFARRDIETAIIPSFVKRICSYSFGQCLNLKSLEFSEDSQIQSIDSNAFDGSSLKRFSIPPSLEELKENWCNNLNKLNQIDISPNNKVFSVVNNNKIIIGKSKNSDDFDILFFACRDIQHAIIPSSVKTINSFAFFNCDRLKSVVFQEDSKLNSINQNAFALSSLNSISIPASIQNIKPKSLKCLKLNSIEFLGDKVYMLKEPFGDCEFILLVACPNADKVLIDPNAFPDFQDDFVLYSKAGAKVL